MIDWELPRASHDSMKYLSQQQTSDDSVLDACSPPRFGMSTVLNRWLGNKPLRWLTWNMDCSRQALEYISHKLYNFQVLDTQVIVRALLAQESLISASTRHCLEEGLHSPRAANIEPAAIGGSCQGSFSDQEVSSKGGCYVRPTTSRDSVKVISACCCA